MCERERERKEEKMDSDVIINICPCDCIDCLLGLVFFYNKYDFASESLHSFLDMKCVIQKS